MRIIAEHVVPATNGATIDTARLLSAAVTNNL